MSSHLRASEYRVIPAPLAPARRLVANHHYAHGTPNTATFCHGLYRRDDYWTLLGVAWWIPPTKAAAIATWDGDWRKVLALSRLVIAPGLPTNAASFLIGQSVRLIRADGRWECLLTYADEWQGHTGAIYRATNWEYLGRMAGDMTFRDPETGRMVARKAGQRTRRHEEMIALGYEPVGRFGKHKFRMVLKPARQARTA